MRTDPPWIAASIAELTAGAEERRAVRPADARSGATFERLVIDGCPRFLKTLSAEDDWIMRVTGNTTHWELKVWSAGLYHAAPAEIDHAMIGMALDGDGPGARLAMLMDDCTADLVPAGDDVLPVIQHAGFVAHLAAFHARFLGWQDTLRLATLEARFCSFAPATIEPELRRPDAAGPIRAAAEGWTALAARAPAVRDVVTAVHRDPGTLADALRDTPATFVAGDWKLGNLGTRPDGRSIVLDWAYPGAAPPCWELAWYLALNRARLPESKEATIARYRGALESCGVDTDGWFDRQLQLCLLGIMATFAWEKALGDAAELDWWAGAVIAGDRFTT